MPSYALGNKPKAYYYAGVGATDPKQIPANPKICIDRASSSCIDYTYPGINKTTHSKTSGFNLLSDFNGFLFKKGDLVRFRIINTTQGSGAYRSAFSGPMVWDTAFAAIITSGEMLQLGTGMQIILMDIHSKIDDTVHIMSALEIEFTP